MMGKVAYIRALNEAGQVIGMHEQTIENQKQRILYLEKIEAFARDLISIRHLYAGVLTTSGETHPGNKYWQNKFLNAYKPLEELLCMKVVNYDISGIEKMKYSKEKFKITDFGSKVFDSEKTGTKITSHSREQMEYDLNTKNPIAETEGYGPFCRLFFFENWTDANVGCVPINDENSHMIRTGYKAREESELPILVRWIEGITAPVAKFLCVVCYDKEQMLKEGIEIESDWGVVAFLGQEYSSEQPMVPATILRNALGIDEGGSGHKLDREDYMRSVEFWENNALML